MSDNNKNEIIPHIRLPRSLIESAQWKALNSFDRDVFMCIVYNASYHEREFNDFGKIINLKVGQACLSYQEIADFCGPLPGNNKTNKKPTKKNAENSTLKIQKLDIMGRIKGHVRNIYNITHIDTYKLFLQAAKQYNGTHNGTIMGRYWDDNGTQTKNDKKDDKDQNLSKNGFRDYGNVDNFSSYQHSPQSPLSFSDLNQDIVFDVDSFDLKTYRLKNGNLLSRWMQNTLKKYGDKKWDRMIENVKFYEKKCRQGYSINNHEKYLQTCISLDLALKEEYNSQNQLYAKWIKLEYKLSIHIMKTIVKLNKKGEKSMSVSLELNPTSFAEVLNNFKDNCLHGAYV